MAKFVRIAVEGSTIDGREITAQQIQEMAAGYNPSVYGARVNVEHFLSLFPGGYADAIGDVVALKAEKIADGSALDGKLGLYAQIKPLPRLMELANAGQKIFASIEMMTNFARTGKAYLVGLAATDVPASLGTQQIAAFGVAGQELLTSAPLEIDPTEFAAVDDMTSSGTSGEGKPSIFAKIKAMFAAKQGHEDARLKDHEDALIEVAERLSSVGDEAASIKQTQAETAQAFAALAAKLEQLRQDHEAFKAQMDAEPAPVTTPKRAPATGGDGTLRTDC